MKNKKTCAQKKKNGEKENSETQQQNWIDPSVTDDHTKHLNSFGDHTKHLNSFSDHTKHLKFLLAVAWCAGAGSSAVAVRASTVFHHCRFVAGMKQRNSKIERHREREREMVMMTTRAVTRLESSQSSQTTELVGFLPLQVCFLYTQGQGWGSCWGDGSDEPKRNALFFVFWRIVGTSKNYICQKNKHYLCNL